MRTRHQPSRGLRRGVNFTVRLTPEERATLEARQRELGGPRALGAWMVWRACLGLQRGDTLIDLFPGTGVVSRAWAELSRAGAPSDMSPRS